MADTCPFDIVNDLASGDCGINADVASDGLCDLSGGEKSLGNNEIKESGDNSQVRAYLFGEKFKEKTVAEVAGIYDIPVDMFRNELSQYLKKTVRSKDSFQFLYDEYALCSGVADEMTITLKNDIYNKLSKAQVEKEVKELAPINTQKTKKKYRFVEITGLLLFFYMVSYILALQKKITILTHRRIWNVILLFVFLSSGLTGLLLVLRINYGLWFVLPLNILNIHVEAGIAMAVISIIHILDHWCYFACIIQPNSKSCKVENKD